MWTSFKDPVHLYNIQLVYSASVILVYTKESIVFVLSALLGSYSV